MTRRMFFGVVAVVLVGFGMAGLLMMHVWTSYTWVGQ